MRLFFAKREKVLNIYLLSIENLDQPLPKKFQKFAERFRNTADQWRALFSDLLLRSVLGKELGLEKVEIQRDAYGKPFCLGRHFNLSHSEKVIVLVTDEEAVGIDVEFIRPLDNLEEMADFLAESEKQDILSKSGDERLKLFYEYWTLKESYVKALGEGLGRCFRASLEPGWHFKRYDLGSEYSMAVCARSRDFPEQPIEVFSQDLL
jgi:4'-phosphopantetheinyl transferase